jgi:hypothetical protein
MTALVGYPTQAAQNVILAASQHQPQIQQAEGSESDLTPEQKMQKRFPQPVRIGDLIGLPVLDDGDSTIGYVREVVRSPNGKIVLIVPYSGWFGWARTEWGKRPVAVPIEVVAILARQLNSVDMSREDYDKAPTWAPPQGHAIPVDEHTLIALGRR